MSARPTDVARPQPRQLAAGDPLIHPKILKLTRQMASGRLKPKDLAKLFPQQPRPTSRTLLPFLQSLDLSTLARVIRFSPAAYWHPIVIAQIGHLLRLRNDEGAWKKLGWQMEVDDELGVALPPKETGPVREHLHALVDAHVSSIFPNHRITPRDVPKRPTGPKGIENPHPLPGDVALAKAESYVQDTDAPKVLVAFQTLFCDFEVLRDKLNAEGKELRQQPGEKREEAAQRIERLVRGVLDAWGPGWSALHKPVDPTPLNDLQGAMDAIVQTYWDVDLSDVVGDLLDDRIPPRLKKAGRPTYVASALLGLLLKKSPTVVYDAVENHRRSHRDGGQRRPQR